MTWFEYMVRFKLDLTRDEADYILFNETCYPCGTVEMTKECIKEYFKNKKQD